MRLSLATHEMRLSRSKRFKPNQIFTIRKIKNQKKWTREEDELLISLAEQFNEKHWKEISKRFVKKNSLQCFSRYKRIRPGIVKGSWKREEDLRITDLVNRHGKAWSKISKILGTRNGKQIRDRFINVLDPEIKKGKFSDEEDKKLIALFKQYGPKWATIAKYYPNRTADMIKNRFHSSIKKKISFDGDNKTCEMTVDYQEYKIEKDSYSSANNHSSMDQTAESPMKQDCSLATSNNNISIQSTFTFSKSGSLSILDASSGSGNNIHNLYDLDSSDQKQFTPSYPYDSDFYPNNFHYDIMNMDREIKVEDVYYGGIFNMDEYFTL